MRFQLRLGPQGLQLAKPETAEAIQREKSKLDNTTDWAAIRREQARWTDVHEQIEKWMADAEWQSREPDFRERLVADTLAGVNERPRGVERPDVDDDEAAANLDEE